MRIGAWLLLIGTVTLVSCKEGPIPIETAPVSGTATLNGKPLEDYRVSFYLMGHPAQEPSIGRVDANGRFTLTTRELNDGAMIGKNEVWLTYDPELPEEIPGRETGTPPPPPKVVDA